MECPYCGREMSIGGLYAGGRAVYRLLQGKEDIRIPVRKSVDNRGGIFLDKVPNTNLAGIGLYSEGKLLYFYYKANGKYVNKHSRN